MKNRAGACNPGRRPSEGHPYEHKAEGGKFLQKFSRIGPAQFGVAG